MVKAPTEAAMTTAFALRSWPPAPTRLTNAPLRRGLDRREGNILRQYPFQQAPPAVCRFERAPQFLVHPL